MCSKYKEGVARPPGVLLRLCSRRREDQQGVLRAHRAGPAACSTASGDRETPRDHRRPDLHRSRRATGCDRRRWDGRVGRMSCSNILF